jgi:hypothetical protein
MVPTAQLTLDNLDAEEWCSYDELRRVVIVWKMFCTVRSHYATYLQIFCANDVVSKTSGFHRSKVTAQAQNACTSVLMQSNE